MTETAGILIVDDKPLNVIRRHTEESDSMARERPYHPIRAENPTSGQLLDTHTWTPEFAGA